MTNKFEWDGDDLTIVKPPHRLPAAERGEPSHDGTVKARDVSGGMPYVRPYGNYEDLDVQLVDGKWIRDFLDGEFNNWGQPEQKKYIPAGELWIEASADPGEIEYFIGTAYREYQGMRSGEAYSIAHDAALAVEELQRYADVAQTANIRQELLNEDASVEVWLVDGRAVRDQLDADFNQGANWCAKKYVPEAEIWIDEDEAEAEYGFIELHERHEAHAMIAGHDYPSAHRLASERELEARRKPELLPQMLRDETSHHYQVLKGDIR